MDSDRDFLSLLTDEVISIVCPVVHLDLYFRLLLKCYVVSRIDESDLNHSRISF